MHNRRLTALILPFLTVAMLGACRVSVHNEEQPEACPVGYAHVLFSVDVTHTMPDGSLNASWETPVLIVLDAKSPDPDYNGVMWLDTAHGGPMMGTIHNNAIPLERYAPYGAQLCWPADKAVGILVRAFLTDVPNAAYDRLRCEIEDGENLHEEGFDYLDEAVREVGTADLIDWDRKATQGPWFGVQCQYIYIPGGYQGDPIAPFRELDT